MLQKVKAGVVRGHSGRLKWRYVLSWYLAVLYIMFFFYVASNIFSIHKKWPWFTLFFPQPGQSRIFFFIVVLQLNFWTFVLIRHNEPCWNRLVFQLLVSTVNIPVAWQGLSFIRKSAVRLRISAACSFPGQKWFIILSAKLWIFFSVLNAT